MKNSALLIFLVILLVGTSCENEFDVVDSWQEIPVVYGLLDVGKDTQFVRVEKAFLDPSTDATVIAQVADSLYFQNVTATLVEMSSGGAFIGNIDLELVDANLLGPQYEREEGVFASSPNWVYMTDESLEEDNRYKLEITTGDNTEPVTAETGVIGEFDIQTPPPPNVSNTFRLWNQLQPATFQWTVVDNALFYDLFIRINYQEVLDGTTVVKNILWSLARGLEPESSTVGKVSEVSHTLLLEFLASNLEPISNVCRDIISIDVVVYAGGEELLQFINVGAANSGLTGTVPLNEYTNLSNGLGIFSTRKQEVVEGVVVSNSVLNELATDPLTADLGFRETGDPSCD
ncbi:MAG: DUF4249 family protein [Bacteroidota bacterium]